MFILLYRYLSGFRVVEVFQRYWSMWAPAALTPATCETKDEINVQGNISSCQSCRLQMKEPKYSAARLRLNSWYSFHCNRTHGLRWHFADSFWIILCCLTKTFIHQMQSWVLIMNDATGREWESKKNFLFTQPCTESTSEVIFLPAASNDICTDRQTDRERNIYILIHTHTYTQWGLYLRNHLHANLSDYEASQWENI